METTEKRRAYLSPECDILTVPAIDILKTSPNTPGADEDPNQAEWI